MALGARISAARAPVHPARLPHDVPDLLAAADLAVVTSVWEGQPAVRPGGPARRGAAGGHRRRRPAGAGRRRRAAGPAGRRRRGRPPPSARLLDDPRRARSCGRRGRAQAATLADRGGHRAALVDAVRASWLAGVVDGGAADAAAGLLAGAAAPSLLARPAACSRWSRAPATDGAAPRTADYVIIAGVAGLRWDDVEPGRHPDAVAAGPARRRSARCRCAPRAGATCAGRRLADPRRRQLRAVSRPAPVAAACPPPGGVDHAGRDEDRRVACRTTAGSWRRTGPCPGAPSRVPSPRGCAAPPPSGRARPSPPPGRTGGSTGTPTSRRSADCCSACALTHRRPRRTIAGDRRRRRAPGRPPRRRRPGRGHRRPAGPGRGRARRPVRHRRRQPRLHVAIARAPATTGGWLTSPTTGRPGYVQVVDLAPTALAALDRPMPGKLFAGGAATTGDGRPAWLDRPSTRLADADREASVQRGSAPGSSPCSPSPNWCCSCWSCRCCGGPAGPRGRSRPRPRRGWSCAPPRCCSSPRPWRAGRARRRPVPWWRWASPGSGSPAVTLAVLAVATVVIAWSSAPGARRPRAARRGRRRRRRSPSRSTCSPGPGCSSTASPATRRGRRPVRRGRRHRPRAARHRGAARRRQPRAALRAALAAVRDGGRRGGRRWSWSAARTSAPTPPARSR